MTAGSQEWSKYPFLIKSNRPGTKRGRSTAGRPTTILSLGIPDHYKPKGRFFCDSKERCRYDLIEVYPAWYEIGTVTIILVPQLAAVWISSFAPISLLENGRLPGGFR